MPEKIAFLFLVYDTINHEDIWKDFFNQDKQNRHAIYIHYKNDVELKHYNDRKLKNCIPTKWGDISLVHAQNLLLTEALKDEDNKHFVFCSNSCVPLKLFDHVYKYLDRNFSYFNMGVVNTNSSRYTNASKYIDQKYFQKASQWCIINRKHAELIVASNEYIKWFENTIGDEHCYITYLHFLNLERELITTPNTTDTATTFICWPDMVYKYNPRRGNAREFKAISEKELNHLINAKCLFGRKFLPQCNLSLLKQYHNSINITDNEEKN